MEKRIFKDRVSQTPNRRKITILQQHANEIIADVEFQDNATEYGTAVNSELLNYFQDNILTAVQDSAAANATSQTAQSNSIEAKTLANEAKISAASASQKSEEALTKATAVETALADRGATIYINGTSTASINFSSDPQTQINSKINSNEAVNLLGNQNISGAKTFENTTRTNKIINLGGTENSIQTKGIAGGDEAGNEADLFINHSNGKRTVFNGNNAAESTVIDNGHISANSADFKNVSALTGDFLNTLKLNGNPVESVVSKKLAQNGYIKYSSGLIIQWGYDPNINIDPDITFNTASCFTYPPAVFVSWQNDATTATYAPIAGNITKTGFKLYKHAGGARSVRQFWLAIGY